MCATDARYINEIHQNEKRNAFSHALTNSYEAAIVVARHPLFDPNALCDTIEGMGALGAAGRVCDDCDTNDIGQFQQLVRTLLHNPKTDVNMRNTFGLPPLFTFCRRATNVVLDVVRLILEHPNIDININNFSGKNIMWDAERYVPEVQELIFSQRDLFVHQEDEYNNLFLCSSDFNKHMAKSLIKAGTIDWKYRNYKHQNLLHNMLESLYRPNVCFRNSGQLKIACACIKRHPEMLNEWDLTGMCALPLFFDFSGTSQGVFFSAFLKMCKACADPVKVLLVCAGTLLTKLLRNLHPCIKFDRVDINGDPPLVAGLKFFDSVSANHFASFIFRQFDRPREFDLQKIDIGVNARSTRGESPLYLCYLYRYKTLFDALLRCGANWENCGPKHESIVKLAEQKNGQDWAKEAVDKFIDQRQFDRVRK